MKKLRHPLLSLLLVLCLIVGSITIASSAEAPDASAAAIVSTGETRNEDIINGQSYNRYNNVVRSYLTTTDSGYMRVYGSDNGTLFAEYYDKDFKFAGNRIVSSGLPMFGGFYESSDRYYVVTGQKNPNENDSVEVIRITRFTKEWKESGYTSLYGANTTTPFVAGRCSFSEYNNRLFIRTSHEMYAIGGVIHQANMTIVMNMKNMVVADYYCDVAHIVTAGFLSHSFNQFITVDTDGTVVCLDHGDARPSNTSYTSTRAAVLGRYLTKADNLIIYKQEADGRQYRTYEYTPVITYAGPNGDNITGAMIGGVACSSTSYLTVGASVEQNDDYRTNTAFNAYLSVTDKTASALGNAQTTVTYLTSFSEDDGRYASNPQLVKVNDDLFLVMWNEFPVDKYVVGIQHNYDENYVMKYLFVDGSGRKLTQIKTAPQGSGAYVSECEPIVRNNKILWYVSDGDMMSSIVEMDLGGNITVHADIVPEDLFCYPINLSQVTVAFRSFDRIPDSTVITADNIDEYVVVSYRGHPLVRDRDYIFTKSEDAVTVRMQNGYIVVFTLRLSNIEGYSYFPMIYSYNWSVAFNTPQLNSAVRDDKYVTLSVAAMRGIGYHVYRKDVATGGDFEKIGTVRDRRTDTFVDKTASRSKVYSYYIREFTYDINGNEVLSDPTSARTVSAMATEEPEETTGPPTPPAQSESDPPAPPAQSESDPPAVTVLLGDVDRDNRVTILDATEIQRYLAKLTSADDINMQASDADLDGKVTILDATEIQRFLAGLAPGSRINQQIDPTKL